MARIVRYENGAGPASGRVLEVISDGIASEWTGKPNVLIDPNEAPVAGLPISQWRVDTATGTLRPATPAELSADTTAEDTVRKERRRGLALNKLDDTEEGVILRGLMLTLLDEINVLRQGLASPLPPITPVQMRNRIRAKISGGNAD